MRPTGPDEQPELFWLQPEFLRSPDALPVRPPAHPIPIHGSAHLARREDLLPLTRPSGLPHDTVLHHACPIHVGRDGKVDALWSVALHFGEELMCRHVLGIGRTGCGKTTELILPLAASQIQDPERTVVLFDVKGELAGSYDELARLAGRAPEDVLRLDLTDAARTVGWNPAGTGVDTDRALDLALHVCRASETRSHPNESPFWIQTSTDLIGGILIALTDDPREVPSLARVRAILDLPRDQFVAWFQAHAECHALQRFRAFLASESGNAYTALTDAANRLLVFLDRQLAAVTSHHELRFARLVERPTVLVVVVPEAHIERLRPLFNLFVQQLIAELINLADRQPGARLPRPVTLFLDEFASALGRLPDFEVRLNTLRSRRVAVVAAVQNLGQVRQAYGLGTQPVLAGFSTKVFFAGLEHEDAIYASQLSGRMTAESTIYHEMQDQRTGEWRVHARDRVAAPRQVLEPDEIDRPREHFELGRPTTWFLTERPPFQCWLVPAHRTPELGRILGRARLGEFADRGRRPTALHFDPSAPPQRRRERRLASLEAELGLQRASRRARARWAELRRRDTADELFRAARALRELRADVDEFFAASDRCGLAAPDAVIAWLHFERTAALCRARAAETGMLPFPDPDDDPGQDPGEDHGGAHGAIPDGDVPF
ncbi:MAG: type IV secretory system conjugative DNA transfer family protein [Planctomycetes bacterium]|nr:type IV secretory system conjugative DNA transfer family protein [Planctomycetota bacterium]